MSEDDILFFYPGAPQQEQHGVCPTCAEPFTVIVDLDMEVIYQAEETPLPPGHEVRPPDYCVCFSCGSHLWLETVRAFRVFALGPVPAEDAPPDQLVDGED